MNNPPQLQWPYLHFRSTYFNATLSQQFWSLTKVSFAFSKRLFEHHDFRTNQLFQSAQWSATIWPPIMTNVSSHLWIHWHSISNSLALQFLDMPLCCRRVADHLSRPLLLLFFFSFMPQSSNFMQFPIAITLWYKLCNTALPRHNSLHSRSHTHWAAIYSRRSAEKKTHFNKLARQGRVDHCA